MNFKKEKFGVYKNQEIYSFTFNNDNDFSVECISYGATLKSLYFPCTKCNGENKSVVLGYDNLNDYLNDTSFLGSSIGRTAGRIGKAEFKLNNKMYNIDKNNGNNNLHGGKNGFHSLVWKGEEIVSNGKVGVKFLKTIKSEDDMFPGDIDVEISYLLNNINELEINFKGYSNQDTLFNPTNHAYFNLNFNQSSGVLDHYLTLNADKRVETDGELIPTGNRIDIANGDEYDFRTERLVGDSLKILTKDYSVKFAGLDTPFCLNNSVAAILRNFDKTRSLTITTDRNAVVVYTANYFDDEHTINGVRSSAYMGIALEAQTLPDAIRHEDFGNVVMNSGVRKEYKTTIKMTGN